MAGEGVMRAAWLLIALSGPAIAQTDSQHGEMPIKGKPLALKLPAHKEVVFRGVVNSDEGGMAPGGMMYPAPNPLAFLAAIATHAIIMDGAKQHQTTRQQTEADKVLQPYQTLIEKMDAKAMMNDALASSTQGKHLKTVEAAPHPPADSILESTPVFWMTADQESIIVDNLLNIRHPGDADKPAYSNVIRVISTAHNAQAAQAYWTGNGSQLSAIAVKLLAESIDIGLTDANAASSEAKPFRTIRYYEGGQEKMERAQLLNERCGPMILKTLRGTLMSVPKLKTVATQAANAICQSNL